MICEGFPHVGCENEARHRIFSYDLCDACANAYVDCGTAELKATVERYEKAIKTSIAIAEEQGRPGERLSRMHARLRVALVPRPIYVEAPA